MKKFLVLLFNLCFISACQSFANTDEQIKQIIIKQSIANYSGNCPCPYNSARNGSRCGGRSAYSRAGGYAPLCYPSDVTPKMVDDYKKRNKLN